MIPSDRLVVGTAVLAVAGFLLVPVFGALPLVVLLCGLVTVAAADLVLLDRATRPSVTIDTPKIAQLRKSTSFSISTTRPVAVALGFGPELGGPVPPLHVHDRITLSVVPRARGRHAVGEIWTVQESRVGLWSRRTVHRSLKTLEVWPDLGEDGDSLGVHREHGAARGRSGLSLNSLELRGLRPFVSGDDVRHVDWKATARHQQPIVREWEPERHRTVIVALDAGRLMRASSDGETKFDAALRAMVRLAVAASDRGDRVGALIFDEATRRFVPPLDGKRQAAMLLEHLNDVSPSLVQSDLRPSVPFLLAHRRRSLVLVLTDLADTTDADRLSNAFLELRRVHRPVAVLLRGSVLDRVGAASVRNREEAYRLGAARLVQQGRERHRQALSAAGVDAVDVPTSRLASEVVGAYIKASGEAGW
ncbi:MAG: DUF58 domain-containing protein [Myxococcota bacterium]